MTEWLRVAWGKVRWMLAGIAVAFALLGTLWLILRDKLLGVAKDPAPEIERKAQDAHDAEEKRLADLPAHDVVDALPNAGQVRSATDAGSARIDDLFDRARMGRAPGPGKSRTGKDS